MFMTLVKLCIFIFITVCIYYIVPKKLQYEALLVANIFFYVCFGTIFLVPLFFATISSYLIGIWLDKENKTFLIKKELLQDSENRKQLKKNFNLKKKIILFLGLICILGVWIIFKSTGWIGILGLSYFSLIAVGYCIDVYRGKYEAERNLLRYATFLTLFFQIIQGPFSRYDKMKETLFETHYFSYQRVWEGGLRILWGMFKKCIVAEKILPVVSYIYQNYQDMNGIYIFIVMFLWIFELYADFSGYMDIMSGAAHIFDIRIPENFRQPFFAKSIEEFWRRWHITLGAWFKDYLFYPVSIGRWAQNVGRKLRTTVGSRIGRLVPSYIALFIVWTATGLWHGFHFNFWIWGMMQMIVIIFSMQMEPIYEKIRKLLCIKNNNRFFHLWQMIRTVLLFGFIEIMSQATDFTQAIAIYKRLFTRWDFSVLTSLGTLLPKTIEIDRYMVLIGILTMLLVDILREKNIQISECLRKIPSFPRYLIYLFILYSVILLSSRGTSGGGFMYANF